MRYFAQADNRNQVTSVVVCEDISWIQKNLGGTWVETKIDDAVEKYAGIGSYFESDHPIRFASQWVQPDPGVTEGYSANSYFWHNGKIYQSTRDNNVSEPGTRGWKDKDELIPTWKKLATTDDAWNLDAEVLHRGKQWKSLVRDNVGEPGAVGSESLWKDITETNTGSLR